MMNQILTVGMELECIKSIKEHGYYTVGHNYKIVRIIRPYEGFVKTSELRVYMEDDCGGDHEWPADYLTGHDLNHHTQFSLPEKHHHTNFKIKPNKPLAKKKCECEGWGCSICCKTESEIRQRQGCFS